MENIDKILSLKNVDVRKLAVDLVILFISGSTVLLIGPYLGNALPSQFWVFSLLGFKAPTDGILTIEWIFFTFLLFLLLKRTISKIKKISRRNSWNYSPPLTLSDLIYQGWLEVRENKEIFLTNSNSGLLFKQPWLKNFKLVFKFNFEYLETAMVGGIFKDKADMQKLHKFNYMGVLFRAQSLEDYFMLSIGFAVNIDDYNSQLKRFNSEQELFKEGKFGVVITPHIKLNGNWEKLGGKSLDATIEVNKFTSVECVVSGDTATIEINGKSLTWNLPTNFDGAIFPTKIVKQGELIDAKSTEIPFRLSSGMIGFRSYYAEHSIVKDVVITKI